MNGLFRIGFAVLLYGAVLAVLMAARPSLMFDANGQPKRWGTGTNETTSLFAPALFFPLMAVLCYFAAIAVDMVLA